ncbi:hypothetical protein BKA81DRAFT_13767 [Phyllosticta paracitricarpa]|uniref:Uncharacterized protein n=1 Tax=Phyllosticta paracitricarpa TaxID=2016321 RepID=A0ABR1N7N0_9PEZI
MERSRFALLVSTNYCAGLHARRLWMKQLSWLADVPGRTEVSPSEQCKKKEWVHPLSNACFLVHSRGSLCISSSYSRGVLEKIRWIRWVPFARPAVSAAERTGSTALATHRARFHVCPRRSLGLSFAPFCCGLADISRFMTGPVIPVCRLLKAAPWWQPAPLRLR